MPPPTRTPRPTKEASKDGTVILALFLKNLDEIERHHRRQATGHELGQHVISSLVLSDVATALRLALEGRAWDPANA
jgi:hypothetical protein